MDEDEVDEDEVDEDEVDAMGAAGAPGASSVSVPHRNTCKPSHTRWSELTSPLQVKSRS